MPGCSALSPATAEELKRVGNEAFVKGDYATAITNYDAAIALCDDNHVSGGRTWAWCLSNACGVASAVVDASPDLPALAPLLPAKTLADLVQQPLGGTISSR